MKKFTLMSPVKMQLICNIQGMQQAIDKNLHNSYQELQAMTEEELREKQDKLLPQYNEAIKTK